MPTSPAAAHDGVVGRLTFEATGLVAGQVHVGEGWCLCSRIVRPHNLSPTPAGVALGARVLLRRPQQLPAPPLCTVGRLKPEPATVNRLKTQVVSSWRRISTAASHCA
jgi:hypothetical protein